MIFIVIELVVACLVGFLYLFQGIFLGAAMASSGEATTGTLCLVISIVFVLIIIAIPGMKMRWALAVHKSMKMGALTSDDRTLIITLIVLSFLFGGWITAIMYIIILSSWKELTSPGRMYPQGGGMYQQPGMASNPPGYDQQQYPDELNW